MKNRRNHLEGLIALLLFGVFAVCLLMVLLSGADAYQNLTEKDQMSYDNRVCGQYIATQVRQYDHLDSISIVKFGEGDALSLSQEIDGELYTTIIYRHGSYLMELFCSAYSQMSPEDGEKIMPIQELMLSFDGSMLRVQYKGIREERLTSMLLSPRSGKEASYEK
ncbi:DUF4860 domain-containing protein [Ihubacter sp. mB4P-1]|uniref:DUF4860 domain-containing protein n=1 Tax=Ihubacter sp. mB4P-1 TaxID=3242370 RepID=UPI00137A8BE6